MNASNPDARIVDLGFARHEGPRAGRVAAVVALARWSALRALGARRPWTAKVIPVALVMLAFGPALVVLGLKAMIGGRIKLPEVLPYDGYYAVIGITIMVWVAVTTPELVCPDRRDRVLGLYVATAVSPFEYLIGKIIAAIVPLLFLTLVPQLFLYVGNAVFDVDAIGYVTDRPELPLKIVVSGLLLAVYWAFVSLAVSSLTDRRAFAVGGFLGLVLATQTAAGILSGITNEDKWLVFSIALVPLQVVQHIFGISGNDIPSVSGATWAIAYCVIVGISALILVGRYRRIDA